MRAVLLMLALILATPQLARAGDDVTDTQSTIRAQIEALARDDSAAAFSFAAPALQKIFMAPEIFMTMVRNNYAPVYRHRSFTFGEARAETGSVAQKVQIVDETGEPWLALYTAERQDNGDMKITGCTLVKETGA